MPVETLSNDVNPLFWDVPITNADGTPTAEFMRKWEQQAAVNESIPNLTTAAAVSAILDIIGSAVGDLLIRGTFDWGVLGPNTAGYVLTDGGAGAEASWQQPHYIPSGGTTGQVLGKNSSTNYDVSWQNPTGAYSDSYYDSSGSHWTATVLSDATPLVVLTGAGVPVYINI